MSRPQDGRKISIDEAVETVVAEATGAAMKKAADEVKRKLDSATEAAEQTTEDLEAATADAREAVARGGSAIRRLYQLVWAVAFMPVVSALADPIAGCLQGESIAACFQGESFDAVQAFARLAGALVPLAVLFIWRRVTRQTGGTVLGVHGKDDAGSPRP